MADDGDEGKASDLSQGMPMSTGATVRLVAAPGGLTEAQARAPPEELHKSKRYDGITAYAGELQEDRGVLDEQTRAKNREFLRRLHGLEERRLRWERHLEIELQQREVVDDEIRAVFFKSLNAVEERFMATLAKHDAFFEEEVRVMDEDRQCKWYDSFRHFVDVTVPDVIDKQSGAVTRHLHKSRETFEIENTKLLKREDKIWTRFAAHKKEVKQVGRGRHGGGGAGIWFWSRRRTAKHERGVRWCPGKQPPFLLLFVFVSNSYVLSSFAHPDPSHERHYDPQHRHLRKKKRQDGSHR